MALRSLIHVFLGAPAPFVAPQSLRPLPSELRLRAYSPEKSSCTAIYEANEPNRFPTGFADDFCRYLDDIDFLKLVFCAHERPVAIGGIRRYPTFRAQRAWLVFGIISPGYHNKGIGTALLLSRLAALPKPRAPTELLMSTVPASMGFFRRFGFSDRGPMKTGHARATLNVCAAHLSAEGWHNCRLVLRSIGISPDGLPAVPTVDIWRRSMRGRQK